MPPLRSDAAEDLVRRLAAALRAAQLYSPGHPLVKQSIDAFGSTVNALLEGRTSLVLGIVGEDVVVDERPIVRSEALMPLIARLKAIGVERIGIDSGVGSDEIAIFSRFIATAMPGLDAEPPLLTRIRMGRVTVTESPESDFRDLAAMRRLYSDASEAASQLWDSATTEGRPDTTIARNTVEQLAQAVSENRSALLALTALRDYDNYTFTHMVNVSILTMAQARALGIDGALLREMGVAALMHDIGKVRTPLEILTKADALTVDEFAIIRRHPVDGAVMLRSTANMPTLAAIVAFEHHLRIDGSGYPESVQRRSLNLATMLCSIADVYDAMRSQRAYQRAFPTDRIMAVLQRNDGRQFDAHLVRRFSQLVGVYPVGNVVALTTGETAVVRAVHAPDPRRPRVRVIRDRHGVMLPAPVDVNLWEVAGEGELAPAIVAPLDPHTIGIDPLTLL